MARQLIAGNWKMNGSREAAASLAGSLASRQGSADAPCDWALCPPFPLLALVGEALAGSGIALGAQDCHTAASGAHTGDTSATLLADLGCRYVIVGHSERRADHGEGDELVRAKAETAQAAGLSPIVCIGETRAERDAGQALAVVERQLRQSLPEKGRLVVAYEPVWAIGTGLTATPDDVAEIHDRLHEILVELRGEVAAREINILYGGSVKPGNAAELLSVPHVGGALVGGASLDADAFWAIGMAAQA